MTADQQCSIQDACAWVEENRELCLEALRRLVAQPSVSSQGWGVQECAELLEAIMGEMGIPAQLLATEGFPVVFGSLPGCHPRSIMFYGHYDVQPAGPSSAWDSPPFSPILRDGRIFGRGTADNKGQLLAHVLATRAILETAGSLPVGVKFLFEGEEESGSPNLERFCAEHHSLLDAFLVYTADGPVHPSGRPLVCFGVRGLLYVEIEVRGVAGRDLHSGHYGNVVPSPAWEAVYLLAGLRDKNGHVSVPGFYDRVVPPTHAELALLRRIPSPPEDVVLPGESRSLAVADYYRALMFEPSFNISGMAAGHVGEGMKTVIPSRAMVRLDIRLVEAQNPEEVYRRLEEAVEELCPGARVRKVAAVPPSRTSLELPVSRAVVRAVGEATGIEPVVIPCSGATLPDYVFTKVLGIPSVMVPYANPDASNHASNENLSLDAFFRGIKTTIYVLHAVAGEM